MGIEERANADPCRQYFETLPAKTPDLQKRIATLRPKLDTALTEANQLLLDDI